MANCKIVLSDEGEKLSVVGDRIRILIDGNTTGGQLAVFEGTADPGIGPPMHRHARDDELFYVIEGAVRFAVEGNEQVLNAGAAAYIPRGTVHTFMNVGDKPSRMLVVSTPAGLEGPFREADHCERAGDLTIEKLHEIFGRFDLQFVGPPLNHNPGEGCLATPPVADVRRCKSEATSLNP